MNKCNYIIFLMVFVMLMGLSFDVAAQCIPGTPCILPLTQNDPEEWPISPNTYSLNRTKTNSDLCDADFMNQIYARAYLEADRENVINKAAIAKPDSVLEYSCFGDFVGVTAGVAGPMFSETSYWHDYEVEIDGRIWEEEIETVLIDVHIGLKDDDEESEDTTTTTGDGEEDEDAIDYMWYERLDNSLELLVFESLGSYLRGSFWHPFAGGRLFLFNNVFIDNPLDSVMDSIFGARYNCSVMDNIYYFSKCTNFGGGLNRFYDFKTLASVDPRLFPAPCFSILHTARKNLYIDVAENKNFSYVAYDKLNPLLDYVRPGQCSYGVSTGVLVKRGNFSVNQQYGNVSGSISSSEERICINPGCSGC